MELIKPGVYFGEIVDWALTETKSGKIMAVITVSFLAKFNDGFEKKLTQSWYGGFSTQKAKEYTFKTLRSIGLKSDDMEIFARGPAGQALPMSGAVKITLSNEVNPKTGLTMNKIKYLNGGGKYFAPASPEKIRALFGGGNFNDQPDEDTIPF